MSNPTPGDSPRKLEREITVFLCGYGVFLAVAGILLVLNPPSGRPPPLFGWPRHLALGLPTLSLGLGTLLSGVAFGLTKTAASAWAGGLCTAAFTMGLLAMVNFSPSLLTGVAVVIPLLVGHRVGVWTKARREEEKKGEAFADEGGSGGKGGG
ncbi:MAG: hypothetical protein IT452_04440 [Planctomycetia bacterium]|nr:hypothetical protein [Planctomycetia bacterium]